MADSEDMCEAIDTITAAQRSMMKAYDSLSDLVRRSWVPFRAEDSPREWARRMLKWLKDRDGPVIITKAGMRRIWLAAHMGGACWALDNPEAAREQYGGAGAGGESG